MNQTHTRTTQDTRTGQIITERTQTVTTPRDLLIGCALGAFAVVAVYDHMPALQATVGAVVGMLPHAIFSVPETHGRTPRLPKPDSIIFAGDGRRDDVIGETVDAKDALDEAQRLFDDPVNRRLLRQAGGNCGPLSFGADRLTAGGLVFALPIVGPAVVSAMAFERQLGRAQVCAGELRTAQFNHHASMVHDLTVRNHAHDNHSWSAARHKAEAAVSARMNRTLDVKSRLDHAVATFGPPSTATAQLKPLFD